MWYFGYGYKWTTDKDLRIVYGVREQAVEVLRRNRQYYCERDAKLTLVKLKPEDI
jgi:hypothetical protein